MYVTYRLCRSKFTDKLSVPVFAGQDGSIVVLNEENRWIQLNQSFDLDKGAWVVSIQKRFAHASEKPRLEKSVHTLVCTAWHGEPPSAKHVVEHKNGDRLDNRAQNLGWSTHLKNSLKASKRERSFPTDFESITIHCQALRHSASILDAVVITKTDGAIVDARTLMGSGRGRPPTRISSLLEAFYLADVTVKTPEKNNFEFGPENVENEGEEIRIWRSDDYFSK